MALWEMVNISDPLPAKSKRALCLTNPRLHSGEILPRYIVLLGTRTTKIEKGTFERGCLMVRAKKFLHEFSERQNCSSPFTIGHP